MYVSGPSASRTFAIANSLVLRNRENLVTRILGGLQYRKWEVTILKTYTMHCRIGQPKTRDAHSSRLQAFSRSSGTVAFVHSHIQDVTPQLTKFMNTSVTTSTVNIQIFGSYLISAILYSRKFSDGNIFGQSRFSTFRTDYIFVQCFMLNARVCMRMYMYSLLVHNSKF